MIGSRSTNNRAAAEMDTDPLNRKHSPNDIAGKRATSLLQGRCADESQVGSSPSKPLRSRTPQSSEFPASAVVPTANAAPETPAINFETLDVHQVVNILDQQAPALPPWDEWEFDAALEDLPCDDGSAERSGTLSAYPFAIPRGTVRQANVPLVDSQVPLGNTNPTDAGRQLRATPTPAAWGILSFGIAILMCGGMLMFWSLFGNHDELWSIGTPMALGGQALVLVGLVLQLDVMTQSSLVTAATLHELDEKFRELQHSSVRHDPHLTSTPTRMRHYGHLPHHRDTHAD